MSKGKDSKKQEKKKPLKTLMEKRAAKRAKKENKSFALGIKLSDRQRGSLSWGQPSR